MDEVGLELAGPGRWVDEATVSLGQGADAVLRRGLVFPVVDPSSTNVGFVFVGSVSTALPVGEGALSVRATVPGADLHDERWWVDGALVVALGQSPDFTALAETGRLLADDPREVVFLDDLGREVAVVTDLHPRSAFVDARQALRRRTELLAAAGLDPQVMLAREAWRTGEPRRIVEIEPLDDLRRAARMASDDADLARPWLTWVVDPTGLVDDARHGVVGVHGPAFDDAGLPIEAWRTIGGSRSESAPSMRAVRGAANVVVGPVVGPTATGDITVRLTLEAGEPSQLVDLWIPETENLPLGAVLMIASDPEPVLTLSDGRATTPLELPFGVRRVEGSRLHTFLLPETLAAGASTTVDVHWVEKWDIGGLVHPDQIVSAAYMGPTSWWLEADSVPEQETLGHALTGTQVFPRVATHHADYPAEIRLGTTVPGWQVALGADASPVIQDHGTLWVGKGTSSGTVSFGRYKEFSSRAHRNLPPIRVWRHRVLDSDLLISIRAILNFYGTALPPYPYPDLVVAQGKDRPVVLSKNVLPEFDPKLVGVSFRSLGNGQLELQGAMAIPTKLCNPEFCSIESDNYFAGKPGDPTEVSLAYALAQAWWEGLPWTDRDRWLSTAIPALYRDRFVEERWGRNELVRWDERTRGLLEATEPTTGTLPLTGLGVGSDEEWARERGVRLLRTIQVRVGEKAMLRALAAYRAAGDPSVEALDAALTEATGQSFQGFFDVFALAGLRPAVTALTAPDGSVTFTADPPVGTWDLPVGVGGRVRWVKMTEGSGSLPASQARGELSIDPFGLLPLGKTRVKESRPARGTPVAPDDPETSPSAALPAGAAGSDAG